MKTGDHHTGIQDQFLKTMETDPLSNLRQGDESTLFLRDFGVINHDEVGEKGEKSYLQCYFPQVVKSY